MKYSGINGSFVNEKAGNRTFEVPDSTNDALDEEVGYSALLLILIEIVIERVSKVVWIQRIAIVTKKTVNLKNGRENIYDEIETEAMVVEGDKFDPYVLKQLVNLDLYENQHEKKLFFHYQTQHEMSAGAAALKVCVKESTARN
ncbi:hypothetical protein G6F26_004096 [Rhizopus arrhizus]|nr:hypothetical protein G6F23_001399 [Rhizopus arrhizus]KAG0796300.1 hypothetical protein G6F21_001426 [Rhizopus arrhizus]KAG0950321.1 hypothetical protein G6F30_001760 [Rhizopus arrhizus]KAG1026662.1 hypothetical protein G6F26_004096 [Rhizopus arrhizus]KAG1043915.1 hypothetical protein G6F25_002050 [Rhizopus arrhizus]